MGTAEIPYDVLEAILLLLPVKSLMRFKCIDKSRRDLIRNPSFAALRPDDTHLLILCLQKYHKCKQAILTATINGGETTSDHTLTLRNILEHGHFYLSCCHGLISMHPSHKAKGNTFVYNPNTRETVTIPFNANAFKDGMYVRSFIGFEPVSNQYKLIILSGQCKECAYISKHCEIITLGGTNNNWRRVVFNETPPLPLVYGHSTCLNGALHWLAFGHQRIVVFDLKFEKFGTILVPEGTQESKRYEYKLGQVHGRLILVECGRYRAGASFELWTLKDYDNGVWVGESFYFSLPEGFPSTKYIGRYIHVVGSINNDEILICLGLEVFGYDMRTKEGRRINVRGETDKRNLEDVMLYTGSMRCY